MQSFFLACGCFCVCGLIHHKPFKKHNAKPATFWANSSGQLYQFFPSCFTRSTSSFYSSVLCSLVWFRVSRGAPCSFTHICSIRLTLLLTSFNPNPNPYPARVSPAHVVMSSPASANIAPLEPNVVISNDVHDAVEVDDTDHVEFDLNELK